MADVAARLREAREEAGLSIGDLSARTKIKPTILLNIEHGAFEQLPGGEFFTRAFLRTYARELHLPVDEIMASYDSARPVPVVVQAPGQTTSRDTRDDARSAWLGWPVAAVIVAGMVILFVMPRSAPVADTELRPVATTGTSRPGAPPPVEATTGSAPPESLIVVIRPIRRLWVTGTADGERVLFRLLEPGDEVTVRARETMTFRLGDAGAFGYALNGVPGKPPGRDGEVRDFVIDRSNHRQLAR
ncbi:helix-turn-helix domain-containing protein [soil metagenome]